MRIYYCLQNNGGSLSRALRRRFVVFEEKNAGKLTKQNREYLDKNY